MKYSSGRSRIRKAGADPDVSAAGAGEENGKPWAERFLMFCGILAVALTLAVPMAQGQTGEARGRSLTVGREVAAVMSTAVRDPEKEEEARDPSGTGGEEAVSAQSGESVYDGIGRFFARLLTGG